MRNSAQFSSSSSTSFPPRSLRFLLLLSSQSLFILDVFREGLPCEGLAIFGVELTDGRNFSIFRELVANNSLFPTSTEGMFKPRSKRPNWRLPIAFTVFLSRNASFIKPSIFESFITLPFIVMIPRSFQLIFAGTALSNKYFNNVRARMRYDFGTLSSIFRIFVSSHFFSLVRSLFHQRRRFFLR